LNSGGSDNLCLIDEDYLQKCGGFCPQDILMSYSSPIKKNYKDFGKLKVKMLLL